MSIHVWMKREPHFLGTQILIGKIDESSRRVYIAKPVNFVWEEQKETDLISNPTFSFNAKDGDEFLNGLAQALAEGGFKPDVLQASDKELEAIKYHLEDMRSLVFGGNNESRD